jgi:cell division protein FtsQ
MATRTKQQRADRRRRLLRGLGLVVLVLALGAAWVWGRTLPLERVDIVGAVHADAAAVADLVGFEPDSVALFSISPALVADRAQRHPWVRAAHVRRLPTGTLRVRVEEREPVALALGADGRPAYFLDADGFRMPLGAAAPAVYDVPVLRGGPDYHPVQPVESAALRDLLAALAHADAQTAALVSEVEWGASPTLWTTPAGGHGSVPVRLAHADPDEQLRRLRAFWDQSVLPRPGTRFRLVDLRFRGQVVTQEGDPPAAPADSSAVTARAAGGAVPPAGRTSALPVILSGTKDLSASAPARRHQCVRARGSELRSFAGAQDDTIAASAPGGAAPPAGRDPSA